MVNSLRPNVVIVAGFCITLTYLYKLKLNHFSELIQRNSQIKTGFSSKSLGQKIKDKRKKFKSRFAGETLSKSHFGGVKTMTIPLIISTVLSSKFIFIYK